MKKTSPLIIIAAIACVFGCTNNNLQQLPPIAVKYPATKTVDTVNDYFGTKVADPYRWLENDTTAEVKQWVDSETAVTNNYLSQIPFRQKIKDRINDIYNSAKYSGAFKNGDNIFYEYKDVHKKQPQIMIEKERFVVVHENYNYSSRPVDSEATVFLDPNKLSKEGTATIAIDGFV